MRGALRARRGAEQDVPYAAQHGGARAALAWLHAARRRHAAAAPAPRAPPRRQPAPRPHRGSYTRPSPRPQRGVCVVSGTVGLLTINVMP